MIIRSMESYAERTCRACCHSCFNNSLHTCINFFRLQRVKINIKRSMRCYYKVFLSVHPSNKLSVLITHSHAMDKLKLHSVKLHFIKNFKSLRVAPLACSKRHAGCQEVQFIKYKVLHNLLQSILI